MTGRDIDINEAVESRWFRVEDTSRLIQSGEVVGAASVVAISQLPAGATVKRR